ncbi:MAG: 2-phosphosulfolactate phosphatase [Sporomusaceae bacterium]|nr:2-phosphosulfolactate phosphatase [Sporomusaceae bacterium]
MKVDVAFLPSELQGRDLSDTVCIVLDVFRATSSIVTAFEQGCQRIIPVALLEEAYETAAAITPSPLLAGERKSIKIEGFDLGNSPFEFSADKVAGKTIVMTTTNGTVAIKAAERAYEILIGSFLNGQALCEEAQSYGKSIVILCAGTDRAFSLEDSLCAGFLAQYLEQQYQAVLSDTALAAVLMYQGAANLLAMAAKRSENGRRLMELGKENEILYCLTPNRVNVVPVYKQGEIIVHPRNTFAE